MSGREPCMVSLYPRGALSARCCPPSESSAARGHLAHVSRKRIDSETHHSPCRPDPAIYASLELLTLRLPLVLGPLSCSHPLSHAFALPLCRCLALLFPPRSFLPCLELRHLVSSDLRLSRGEVCFAVRGPLLRGDIVIPPQEAVTVVYEVFVAVLVMPIREIVRDLKAGLGLCQPDSRGIARFPPLFIRLPVAFLQNVEVRDEAVKVMSAESYVKVVDELEACLRFTELDRAALPVPVFLLGNVDWNGHGSEVSHLRPSAVKGYPGGFSDTTRRTYKGVMYKGMRMQQRSRGSAAAW